MKMGSKAWKFICEYCNFCKVVTDLDNCDLREHKLTPVPGGNPTFDSKTKEFTTKKAVERGRKFKCPKCGRLIGVKKIEDVQATANEKRHQEDLEARRKKEREQADALDKEMERLMNQQRSKGLK
jgi:hypothetical protein